MANPSTLTITDLTANAGASLPTGDTIDTTGTVPIAAGGKTDRLIIYIENADDAALTVLVKAGDNPPALHAGLGDLSVALAASGGGATAKRVIGPFESARFAQDDGSVNLTFTPATGSPNALVRVLRLPKI